MKITFTRTVDVSTEALQLLKLACEDKVLLEYRDKWETVEEFEQSTDFKTGLRNTDGFKNRNVNGTRGRARELYDLGFLEDDGMAWHETYVVTDLGKEFFNQLKKDELL